MRVFLIGPPPRRFLFDVTQRAAQAAVEMLVTGIEEMQSLLNHLTSMTHDVNISAAQFLFWADQVICQTLMRRQNPSVVALDHGLIVKMKRFMLSLERTLLTKVPGYKQQEQPTTAQATNRQRGSWTTGDAARQNRRERPKPKKGRKQRMLEQRRKILKGMYPPQDAICGFYATGSCTKPVVDGACPTGAHKCDCCMGSHPSIECHLLKGSQ